LLNLHKGKKPASIAQQAEVSLATVYNIAKRYKQAGKLPDALQERPRSGQPSKFNKVAEAHLAALTCSEPPQGLPVDLPLAGR
jgi:transposase